MRQQMKSARRRRGMTIVETTIASSILVGVLAAAFPVMSTMSDAGSTGQIISLTQADNRQALIRMSRDVMNGSLTATDTLGALRFQILTGDDRSTLTGNLGSTTSGRTLRTAANIRGTGDSIGDIKNYYDRADDDDDKKERKKRDRKGSGKRGGSISGRIRSDDFADEISTGAVRPREVQFLADSVLRFQKVLDYGFDVTGEPVVTWGNWVEYRIRNRNLIRIENGRTQVVSANAVGLRVQATTANTLIITLITERRTRETKEIARTATQIEVFPKN